MTQGKWWARFSFFSAVSVSETPWRPTCMIRDPSETNMSDQRLTCLIRPIGNCHALSETDMPDQRLTYLIGDWHAGSETDMPDRRRTCLIRDQHAWLDTNMPNWRPIWKQHAWLNVSNGSPIRHVGLQWVSNQTYWSPMGLQ